VRNLKLTLAYDGHEFFGWAIQPNRPTVQGVLVGTLNKITGEKVRLHGSSRTDAGVHALGQVAHFKTRSPIPPENLQRALNALLPASVRVYRVEEVPLDFHARWHARAKTYRYRILRAPICPPFLRHYVYHYPYPLDAEAMRRAAPLFEGEHDFSTFGTWEPEQAEQSRVRAIFSSRVENDPEQDELIYAVRGRSFLRYMVRKLVGTLLEVGKGRLAPEDIPRLFEARDRSLAGPTVPPEGLYLVEVDYAAELAPQPAATAQPDADSV
jgi:tRNA pseudouridine38-40 synthase